jgi:DNA-binding NtrC family response regulator
MELSTHDMSGCDMAATVLVVEDEVLISDTICDALKAGGFNVCHAETADAAWRYLQSGHEIDVLFTDINLPGDIDGAELAVRARDLRPELPIVYASGRYTSSDFGELVPRSVFLNKPYNLSEVCTLLRRLAPTEH